MTEEPLKKAVERLGEYARAVRQEALRQFSEERDEVNRRLLLTYHCKSQKCSRLLLAVWSSTGGDERRLYRTPTYVLDQEVNRTESTSEGRRKNSRDGDNHWPAGGGDLDELAGPEWTAGEWTAGLTVQCNHVRQFIPASDLVAQADVARATRRQRHYL